MVILDTKINEIIVIKNWSLSTQQNNNHTFNTNIKLSIDLKYLDYIKEYSTIIKEGRMLYSSEYKRDLYLSDFKSTYQLIGCFISSYSIDDDIRVVIHVDYHSISNEVLPNFRKLYRDKVLSNLGI